MQWCTGTEFSEYKIPMGSTKQTLRGFLLVLIALRALLRIKLSLQAFVFSRRVLMKVQEVLAAVEFSKVCPCASEKAICCGVHWQVHASS